MIQRFLFLLIAASLLSNPTLAATTTGNLTVQATVQESCHLDANGGASLGNAVINFGTINSLALAIDADTTSGGGSALSIICTDGTTYDVSADLGNNPSGTQRRMLGGTTDHLPYDLYADSAYSTAIDNGLSFVSATGNGMSQNIDIYARIPAGTLLPAAGNYTDVVVLTITY